MITARYCLILLVLCLLPACSRQESKTKDAKTPPRTQYQAVSEAPLEWQQKAEAFGRELEKHLRAGNQRQFRASFDLSALLDSICSGMPGANTRLNEFKSGLGKGLQQGIDQASQIWARQQCKFKGLAVYKGELAARFRFVSEEAGISIIDFVLRPNPQGKAAIVNFCNHAMGYDMIEQTQQTTAPMLAELDKSFLDRLVNKPGITTAQMKQFGQLSEKIKNQDFKGALQVYRSLPDALRETMAAHNMYIAALQRTGDDAGYKAALKEGAARFRSANYQFMLVDVYALDKDYAKAADCIDAFMLATGKDTALLALKSLMVSAKGDVAGAREILREALELEPDCAYAHAKGLDVLLPAKDYKAVRDSIIFLEKNGDFNFKGKLTDPVWDGFKKAPESEPWR